jgi:hypothetical protein
MSKREPRATTKTGCKDGQIVKIHKTIQLHLKIQPGARGVLAGWEWFGSTSPPQKISARAVTRMLLEKGTRIIASGSGIVRTAFGFNH